MTGGGFVRALFVWVSILAVWTLACFVSVTMDEPWLLIVVSSAVVIPLGTWAAWKVGDPGND